MTTFRLPLVVLGVIAISSGPLPASWTATGSFGYLDRQFDQTGFTGVEAPLPVRWADLEIVDANVNGRNAVIGTGATRADGTFSIAIADSKVRDVYVRVVTTSGSTPGLNIDVRDSSSGKVKNYAVASATVPGHSPAADLDFGNLLIGIGQGGEAFNIYDQMVRGADYVAFQTGARPGSDKHLSTIWGPNNGVGGSGYDTGLRMLVLRDTAGYDDTVILHEMAHYVVQNYSAFSSPGGSHTFSECDQDIRLAFDEGYASYWGNSVLRHLGLPRSNIYTRTTGGPGPGNLVRYLDLEEDTQYLCAGAANEANVAAFLWDITDGQATPDTTPGTDDPHDGLDRPDAEVWQVMTEYLPSAASISLEDFWDGWFLPPAKNGALGAMIAVGAHLGVEYVEDSLEPNDSPADAPLVPVGGTATHATFFRDPDLDGAGAEDQDWFAFGAAAGQLYVLETGNLLSDGNTYLRLYDTDGQTLLGVNDNRSPGDESSRIDWTAPRTDTFHAQVTHTADYGVYGSYDLFITAQSPADNDGDGFDTTTDCNDNDPGVNPGAVETCDGMDQDCDTITDNGFDLDADGFTTCAGDCDDGAPGVNPGADEIPLNGVDDNCNGAVDETPSVDVVTILSAVYKSGPRKILVEATSDRQPDVTLSVVGFGAMTFDPTRGLYTFTSSGRTPNPGTVTVESSGGGSATAAMK